MAYKDHIYQAVRQEHETAVGSRTDTAEKEAGTADAGSAIPVTANKADTGNNRFVQVQCQYGCSGHMAIRRRHHHTAAGHRTPRYSKPILKKNEHSGCEPGCSFFYMSATATTAASGRNREELLGQRPARCKRQRSRCWEPQPVLACGETLQNYCGLA